MIDSANFIDISLLKKALKSVSRGRHCKKRSSGGSWGYGEAVYLNGASGSSSALSRIINSLKYQVNRY